MSKSLKSTLKSTFLRDVLLGGSLALTMIIGSSWLVRVTTGPNDHKLYRPEVFHCPYMFHLGDTAIINGEVHFFCERDVKGIDY